MRVEIEDIPNVCEYCRRIMQHPSWPKTLEVYRGNMLCLTVDVEKAAKLKLVENTLNYVKYAEPLPMTEKDKERLRLNRQRKRTRAVQDASK